MFLLPLHEGPHDSAGDLTAGEWGLVGLLLVALVAIGFAVYKVVQRRKGEP